MLKAYAVPATVSRPQPGCVFFETTVRHGGWEGSAKDKPGDLPILNK
jgi:hypothetical protein